MEDRQRLESMVNELNAYQQQAEVLQQQKMCIRDRHKDLWRAKLHACIDALEHDAEALGASGFTIGHLSIGVALCYLDFRFANLAWRDGHSKLAAWHSTFNARPSVVANPPVDDR